MLYKTKQSKIKYQKYQEKDYFPIRHRGFATLAIHAGQQPQQIHGSVNVPVHLTSTFAQKEIAQPYGKFDYTRSGNPTRDALEQCLVAVQYGKKAITFSSGCGAMSTILHTLKTGDHIIVCEEVYGGTLRYMEEFLHKRHGIDVELVTMSEAENAIKAVRKQTKMVWIESPTNPMLHLIDIQAVSKGVKAKNADIKVIVDNTFASSYISSPLLLGADVSFQSLTKYIGGYSDLVMGALVFKDEQYHKQVFFAAYSLGANPSPFDCYLALRGIKTLESRIIQSTCSAYHIAHFLQKHEAVQSTLYPGLKSNKYHELAKRQMRGYGGMISIKIRGGKQQVSKFLKALKIFVFAKSLGGVTSLAESPTEMSQSFVPNEIKDHYSLTENLVRLSIGNEDLDDLIQDLDNALRASQKK